MVETNILPSQESRLQAAIIGVGALGTEVMLRVARDMSSAFDHASILVIDPDRLQRHNIALSTLFHSAVALHGERLLGRSKAQIATEFLQTRSRICWSALVSEVADVSWYRLAHLQVIISCTDNALARVETTLIARSLGIPMLDGGVKGAEDADGRVAWYSPDHAQACYLCGLSEERRAELLAYASAHSLPCRLPATVAMGGDPRVSASVQKTAAPLVELLRRFCGTAPTVDHKAERAHSFAIHMNVQAGLWSRKRVTLRRSASCPWHDTYEFPLLAVDPDQTFVDALEASPQPRSSRIQFPWPICTLAVCRACGARTEHPRRVAAVRREGICRHCNTPHQLEPLRCTASVGHNEAMVNCTPGQLGFVGRQLLELRPTLVPATRMGEAQ